MVQLLYGCIVQLLYCCATHCGTIEQCNHRIVALASTLEMISGS